ncbi:MAG: hypothetical protein J4G01_07835 [Dehalococcoidia bacterium]|nr:hypothetical protein [Dehalococcoidia bacterium]
MLDGSLTPWAVESLADASVDKAAGELKQLLAHLASRIDPFPNFTGSESIQAIEVEPLGIAARNLGCVVVCPDGELYELNLTSIQGPLGLSDVEHVEELLPLDLPPVLYVPYAHAAVKSLANHLDSSPGPT